MNGRNTLNLPTWVILTLVSLGCGTLQAQVPVTSGLREWLEADVGVQTSGTSVTNWLDQSGNGNHAMQTSAANQPTYLATGFGAANKPSVHFDGLNDFLDAGSGLNITGSGLTIFTLMRLTANANGPGIAGNQGSGGTGYLLEEGTDDRFKFFAGIGVQTADNVTGSWVGKPLLMTGFKDASNVTLYTNGVQAATASSSTSISSSSDNFLIGHNALASGFLNGDIAEILIYDRALTAQERENVTAYFDGKYSLGIPEPSAAALLGLGGMILLWRRR